MKLQTRQRIVLVPYPAQGHLTPILQLAASFSDRGFEPIVVVPAFMYDRIAPKMRARHDVVLVSIPDELKVEEPRDFFTIGYAMEHTMPRHFECLLRSYVGDGGGAACVVVDLLASWAIDVAGRCGIPVAGFWPAMLASYQLVWAIPDLIRAGLISDHGFPIKKGVIQILPGQPMMNTLDLPWLVGNPAARKSRFTFWLQTLHRSRSLKWILVNSFADGFNDDRGPVPHQQPHIFPVGPLARGPNTTLWEEDSDCLEWLSKQAISSVIYVSFGSWVAPIPNETIAELALGLEATQRPFLWVLGSAWLAGLPPGYLDRIAGRSKVVAWAPQREVLEHKAVDCYLTHCGWNSTLEAIEAEKKLLCYPVSGDQFINCRYIVKMWGIGVEVEGGTQSDIEKGVKRVMEEGGEMQRRVRDLKEKVMGEEGRFRATSNLKSFLGMLERHKSL